MHRSTMELTPSRRRGAPAQGFPQPSKSQSFLLIQPCKIKIEHPIHFSRKPQHRIQSRTQKRDKSERNTLIPGRCEQDGLVRATQSEPIHTTRNVQKRRRRVDLRAGRVDKTVPWSVGSLRSASRHYLLPD